MGEISPVVDIIDKLYEAVPGGSYSRLNSALQDQLSLLINSRVKFAEDDFNTLFKEYGGQHWITQGGEWYGQAVEASNISACQSWEHHAEFQPYFLDSQRLYSGREIDWQDEEWTVTSIQREKVIICQYNNTKHERKPSRISSITHKDLREDQKKKRKAREALEELVK